MRLHILLLVSLSMITTSAYGDGEGDNNPDKVRQVPRVGVQISEDDRSRLNTGLEELAGLLEKLKNSKADLALTLLPDVEIYHRAVKDNLEHQEFFSDKDIVKAFTALTHGKERAQELLNGRAPWLSQTGLVVRGYRSELDGSAQPYGLVIPENYQANGEKAVRLDIWFHGRGETLSETNFIDKQSKVVGYYSPNDTIVLHPYGRYSNAFKFAGEIDVLEAMEHVKSQYRINNDLISVRGFSMGGAGCWQFAHLYADRWFAATPGAGFSETPEFLKSFQKETLHPYWWEEKLWRWYDTDDNAINLAHVPLIAYSGEDDIQKQAADIMEIALAKEGISLVHIIGPKTGHRIHPDSQAIIEEKMYSLARIGNDKLPHIVNKITHSLKYNRQYWLTITGLKEHWEPARVKAEIKGNRVVIVASDVTGLKFDMSAGLAPFDMTEDISIEINNQVLTASKTKSDRSWSYEVHWDDGNWVAGPKPQNGLQKKHGLQGPIDDAFLSSFLMVTPTGKPINEAIGKWTASEQTHAIKHWRQHFRGHARIKKDIAVTEEDIENHNLILWGDFSSNKVITDILARLPLTWNKRGVSIGEKVFDAKSHAPIMIYPNPLNPEKYIVINSGFTYREYAYLNNARQVPMLPDWAIVDVVNKPEPNDSIYRFPGIPKDANFFDENWGVK
ncbi:MAG: prolyl oligopeptidase family serine peptidase [Pirellulales bacterium]|nr:prolyl oligopeptidase family serine peptidase [Pirellulales bacterium]